MGECRFFTRRPVPLTPTRTGRASLVTQPIPAVAIEATPGPGPSSEESWGAFYARERIAPTPTTASPCSSLIDKLCERLRARRARPRPAAPRRRRENRHNSKWRRPHPRRPVERHVIMGPGRAVLIDPAAQGGHAEETRRARGLRLPALRADPRRLG